VPSFKVTGWLIDAGVDSDLAGMLLNRAEEPGRVGSNDGSADRAKPASPVALLLAKVIAFI
jgi:hypothetical protein